jgi:hypothetical protein
MQRDDDPCPGDSDGLDRWREAAHPIQGLVLVSDAIRRHDGTSRSESSGYSMHDVESSQPFVVGDRGDDVEFAARSGLGDLAEGAGVDKYRDLETAEVPDRGRREPGDRDADSAAGVGHA